VRQVPPQTETGNPQSKMTPCQASAAKWPVFCTEAEIACHLRLERPSDTLRTSSSRVSPGSKSLREAWQKVKSEIALPIAHNLESDGDKRLVISLANSCRSCAPTARVNSIRLLGSWPRRQVVSKAGSEQLSTETNNPISLMTKGKIWAGLGPARAQNQI
jgi:hypothetical protein